MLMPVDGWKGVLENLPTYADSNGTKVVMFRSNEQMELTKAFVDQLRKEIETNIISAEAGVDDLSALTKFALYVIVNSMTKG